MTSSRYVLGGALSVSLALCADMCLAQGDQDILLDGMPLENAIVGRDVGVRVRGEVRYTDDYDGLIDEDPNFGRFPTRIYSTDVTVFGSDRTYLGVTCSRWENDQDLGVERWGGKFRTPIDVENDTFLYLQFNNDGTRDGPSYRYASVGVDRRLTEDLYTYLVYRYYFSEGVSASHQLSAYVSWKPSSLLRVGGEIAGSNADNVPGASPWYARVFGSVFVVPEWTSLRLEGLHYDTGGEYTSDSLNAYLYQKVGARSLLRFDYRFYSDSQDLDSSAWGVKAKHYFCPAFSAHAGYRWYEHAEGTDFSGPFLGVDMLF